MKQKFKNTIEVTRNSYKDEGEGVVSFPNGLCISDNQVQRNGSRYDIDSLDISKYAGQLTADHEDKLSNIIGRVEGVKKENGRVTVDKIVYAVKQNPYARLAYDLLVGGFSKAFSTETIGASADGSDGTLRNHELVGLSQVVCPNNYSAIINSVRNSLKTAEADGLDINGVEEELLNSFDKETNMDEENKVFTLGGKEYHEGDVISFDGTTGNIYDGAIPTVDAKIAGEFGRIMDWADKYRVLKVRTNADTPADAKKARELGAEGIGLCRTEHMFFEGDRIDAFREMICSDTVEEREAALAKILPVQQGDFEALYEALEGNPVTIRFLDPPLHEFVPTTEEDIEKLAKSQGKTVEQIKAIIDGLHEFNPMMGHRGCRLAVTYPEIAKMQTRAVIRAAINVSKAHPDWNLVPEIMIPLAGDTKELKYVKKFVVETADEEIAAAGADLKYEVGTMIEIPRAALTADEIATEAEFFCFGTNDLTQMTFGFSRDDAGKFLDAYYDAKIFENDPFAKLDQTGVGQLMEMAITKGKATRPELHCGICGEHGGDPSSVEFCHKIGLDYVSCSPFRVPIARLAAAQAAISEGK